MKNTPLGLRGLSSFSFLPSFSTAALLLLLLLLLLSELLLLLTLMMLLLLLLLVLLLLLLLLPKRLPTAVKRVSTGKHNNNHYNKVVK